MNEQVYDIKAAADRLGYTHQYVRMLIQQGKIDAEMVPIAVGANVTKYVMTETQLREFEETVQSRSQREDNRNKWVVYATFKEMADMLDALSAHELDDVAEMIRPANKLKNMPDWLEERLNG